MIFSADFSRICDGHLIRRFMSPYKRNQTLTYSKDMGYRLLKTGKSGNIKQEGGNAMKKTKNIEPFNNNQSTNTDSIQPATSNAAPEPPKTLKCCPKGH